MSRFGQARKLRRAMQRAPNYASWLAAAEQLDRVERNDQWRQDDASPLYNAPLLREHLMLLRRLRQDKQARRLARVLEESLHRHLGEISNPELYTFAHAGTKRLISDYLAEVEQVMLLLCDHETPDLPAEQRLGAFERASRIFGGSALILSGGLAFGIYHLGVVKALWQQGLLPKVISGSSMGAIVAAGVCARDDSELEQLFRRPERIYLRALKIASPRQMVHTRQVLDAQQLLRHIEANVPSRTFREAFQRSGRVLNVTVSPTRSRQKPRVLNHLTAPDVMVTHSALASCAMPPCYPPVMLHARTEAGEVVPYLPTERWIDGSLHGDVPMLRLSRLHNVNHSIVSQANPHVLPFIPQGRANDPVALAWHLLASMARAQAAEILGTSRNLARSPRVRPLLDRAHAVTDQKYSGDINIHFPFRPALYRKAIANPTVDDLRLYIRLGEQATWPQLAIIRDQTRLSRTFEHVIARLRQRVREQRHAGSARADRPTAADNQGETLTNAREGSAMDQPLAGASR